MSYRRTLDILTNAVSVGDLVSFGVRSYRVVAISDDSDGYSRTFHFGSHEPVTFYADETVPVLAE